MSDEIGAKIAKFDIFCDVLISSLIVELSRITSGFKN